MIWIVVTFIAASGGLALEALYEPKTSKSKKLKKAAIIGVILLMAAQAVKEHIDDTWMAKKMDYVSKSRELDQAAMERLVQMFSNAPISTVMVTLTSDDPETRRFADQIYLMLKRANIKVIRKPTIRPLHGHLGVSVHTVHQTILNEPAVQAAIKT